MIPPALYSQVIDCFAAIIMRLALYAVVRKNLTFGPFLR